MPINRRTQKYFESQARIADQKSAFNFISARREEGVHAEVRSFDEKFLGLVLAKAEHDELLAAQITAKQQAHKRSAPHEATLPDDTSLDSPTYIDHPAAHIGDTRMEALEAAHLNYLGRLAATSGSTPA